jgi:hypothetical protein
MWSKLFVLAMLGFGPGCNVINSIGPGCDRSEASNKPIPYDEANPESGLYMSSPWAGELLWFPGGTRYEIRHKLGVSPQFVQLWLSFDQCGTKTSTVALAAGNQAEARDIDHEKIIVVNGSCSDYWLLVVAGTGANSPPLPPDTAADPNPSDGVCIGD